MNLLETIKCENGQLFNLKYHQKRLNKTKKALGLNGKILLEKEIIIPEECKQGLFRCRVIYAHKIEKIEFIPHAYRNIRSLKLVVDDNIDYQFKYSDRNYLNKLFEMRQDCDDILVVKNGLISDTWTANIVFFDGKKWWAPDTPLLQGTQRMRLINEGKIEVCKISLKDLNKYEKAGLINAMQDLQNMPEIKIEDIY